MSAPAGRPLIVLTGFLGSGKTTLLNRWLHDPALAGTAVLINEFGEIGLDHQLVESLDDAPVLLANGCVCCSIRDDLKTALLRLEERRLAGEVPDYARVMIETTGAADPAPILATLLCDPELRHHYHVGGVVTVVDAVNGLRDLSHRAEARRQAALADYLLISKRDLAAAPALEALEGALRTLNPAATLGEAQRAHWPAIAARLADGDVARRQRLTPAESVVAGHDHQHDHQHEHHHGEHFASFTLCFDEAIDWTAFGVWLSLLLHVHGERVLRVKGLLNVPGSASPVVVNGVQHLVHPPYHLAQWPDEDQRSRLVFITEGLAREAVAASLATFTALGASFRPPAADSSP